MLSLNKHTHTYVYIWLEGTEVRWLVTCYSWLHVEYGSNSRCSILLTIIEIPVKLGVKLMVESGDFVVKKMTTDWCRVNWNENIDSGRRVRCHGCLLAQFNIVFVNFDI